MISIEYIRKDLGSVKDAVEKRGDTVPLDFILDLDRKRRAVILEADRLRAQRNDVSRMLGQMKDRPPELIEDMKQVGIRIKALEEKTRIIGEELEPLLLLVPNIPDGDVPVGNDDSDNVTVRTVEEPKSFDFKALSHWELGESLDIIDLRRGAKVSGSRFYVLKGKGARLQRALISWMLDVHTNEHGYEEVYLPYLVSRQTVIGSGQLPKFGDTMYHDKEDDLWLVPTAEVPITYLHGGEIIAPNKLPLNYVANTPCFRREKTAAGRDTRGIKRVHQFEKVEMYKLVEPEASSDALDRLLADAEEICARLEIPYRILELCTGEMGVASAKSYDLEMYAAGSAEWLEVSSCSNCRDFQSRRSNIRYRSELGARPRLVHTLNGSGLALPRVIIAILENFQQPDGSVIIPEVLRPYTDFDRIG